MSTRTNNSPSFEFREKDNSNVTITTNEKVFYIMGYAEKSEPYIPKYVYSVQDFIKEFGEPQTEAEKYFYNACKNVLDGGGTVLAARLPYDNDFESNYKYSGSIPGLPTLSILGNSEVIPNGSLSPSLSNNTDLEAVEVGSSTSAVYTIFNTSLLDLNLNGSPVIDISGSSDFEVTTLPTSNIISPSDTDTFVVTFSASISGVQEAIVLVANNSQNDNPYTFMVQGTGGVNVYEYQQVTVTTSAYTLYEYEEVTIISGA